MVAAGALSCALTVTTTAHEPEGHASIPSANDVVISSDPRSNYPDGSAGAPVGAPQFPHLFSGYAVRPPWKVAGVDYHVGVPSGLTLKDPSVPGKLPAGATLRGHTIIVSAKNVTLSGFDFSGDGGYGIYINSGVSGTRITNNLFVDGSSSAPIPVNIGEGASQTYIGYNTINGGRVSGNASFGELIYNLGTGLTVEYNWIYDSPSRFVSNGGGGSLVYRYNLLEDGGWVVTHLNFLEFGGGTFLSPQVEFNTVIQHQTISNGEGFQMYCNSRGSISNGDVGNNTMISSRAVIQNGARGPAISYWLHAGSNNQYPSPATSTVHDNYIDPSSAYGAIYPALSGVTYLNNVNLLTGGQV